MSSERALEILKNTFGYHGFRHRQEDIVSTLVEGRDALVLMPTGGGKSLCYQLPALIREGAAIVVSPLIALMQDQVEALRQLGIRGAFLNSSLDQQAQHSVERDLLADKLDLLYVAPERLLTERTLDLLKRSKIALFAIDEAHCVSQWGHDFRREYQRLNLLHEQFSDVPRIALTATADERTRREIISQLDLSGAEVFVNSFDRPNIRYTISEGQNARDRLWRFIEEEYPGGSGIVYCLSRKKVEAVAEWLSSRGRLALPYHAGLRDDVRHRHQDRFLREDGVIIVATIAFGMGIDKPDVRFVAHLNLPKSIESYYQETGRAGRDGLPADAWMAYGLKDVVLLRQMSLDSDADELYKRVSWSKLESLLGLCEQTTCRRQTLLSYFGEMRDSPCGNCDNCLNPPETWDGTDDARKALSCIYRTGQRFGANYVVNVLTGRSDQRIASNRHDRLSTFGLGTHLDNTEWRSVLRQLLAQGYVTTDMEGHGTLRLTEKARPLLRGEETLRMRRQRKAVSAGRARAKPAAGLSADDLALFDRLRSHRTALAKERSIPPYIIFHDRTLEEIARLRPGCALEFRSISGVGDKKLAEYGDGFLAVVRDFGAAYGPDR